MLVKGRLEFEREKMATLATMIAIQTRGKRILSPDELLRGGSSPVEQAKRLQEVTEELLRRKKEKENGN